MSAIRRITENTSGDPMRVLDSPSRIFTQPTLLLPAGPATAHQRRGEVDRPTRGTGRAVDRGFARWNRREASRHPTPRLLRQGLIRLTPGEVRIAGRAD